MTEAVVGNVTKSDTFFDFRFLNPFEKFGANKFYGQRYGYVQFIFIACTIISLVMVGIYSKKDTNLLLKIFMLFITYFMLYYNISCLLVPNNHERCWILMWLFLICIIISTVLSIFGESLFINMKKILTGGGSHNDKKSKVTVGGGSSCGSQKDKKSKSTVGGKLLKFFQLGGSSCGSHKDKKSKITVGGEPTSSETTFKKEYENEDELDEDELDEDELDEDELDEDELDEDELDEDELDEDDDDDDDDDAYDDDDDDADDDDDDYDDDDEKKYEKMEDQNKSTMGGGNYNSNKKHDDYEQEGGYFKY